MKRSLIAGALICASLLAMAPAAEAAPRWGITAINIGPQIASDNDRYVAFQRRNRMPVVVDTRTGEFEVLKAWLCKPRDIGGTRVLMICPHRRKRDEDSGFRARTGSIFGGDTTPLVKSRKIEDAYEVGNYWVPVKIPTIGYERRTFGFLNWRDGKLRKYQSQGHPFAFGAIDLDSPELGRADIQTFRPELDLSDFRRFKGPYFCRGKEVVISDWKGELRLWKNRYSSVQLGRGGLLDGTCKWHQSLRIGTNWVTWSRGGSLHAYNYRTGRRFDRRFPLGSRITPMRDGVVVAKKLKKYGKYYKAFRVRYIRLG